MAQGSGVSAVELEGVLLEVVELVGHLWEGGLLVVGFAENLWEGGCCLWAEYEYRHS